MDQRPGFDAVGKSIAETCGSDFRCEFLRQRGLGIGVYKNAIGGDADLSRDEQLQTHKLLGDEVQIGIRQHDERSVASEFEREPLDARRGGDHERATGGGRTGETQHAHRRMLREDRADHGSTSGHDLQHTIGQTRLTH